MSLLREGVFSGESGLLPDPRGFFSSVLDMGI